MKSTGKSNDIHRSSTTFPAGCGVPRAQQLGAALAGVVCPAKDLIALGSSLSTSAEDVAELLSMSPERVRLLGRRPSSSASAVVVCWLKRGSDKSRRPAEEAPNPAPRLRLSSESVSLRDSRGSNRSEEASLLLRQLLSDSRPLCSHGVGLPDGALLAALAPARRGTELSRQLKMQLLQEKLAAPRRRKFPATL
eukprot:Skav207455  [mRNA]  locus=scaffold3545:97328:104113:+ [translate_table: standard]